MESDESDGISESENEDPQDEVYIMETSGPIEKDPNLTLDYKKRAVEWSRTTGKSGKLPKPKSVLNKFKLCTSERMLRRWKQQLNAGISFSLIVN